MTILVMLWKTMAIFLVTITHIYILVRETGIKDH
jgi:hypothetical protein